MSVEEQKDPRNKFDLIMKENASDITLFVVKFLANHLHDAQKYYEELFKEEQRNNEEFVIFCFGILGTFLHMYAQFIIKELKQDEESIKKSLKLVIDCVFEKIHITN